MVAQSPQGLERFALAQAARAFHFFCPNKEKETKQRRVVEDYVRKKFAVCTFWATSASVSAKQKELASLKQLFLLHGKEQKFLHASPRRPGGSLPGGWHIASLVGVWCFLFLLRSFLPSRAKQSVVKDLENTKYRNA